MPKKIEKIVNERLAKLDEKTYPSFQGKEIEKYNEKKCSLYKIIYGY